MMDETLQELTNKINHHIELYNNGTALGVHPYEVADTLVEIEDQDHALYESLLQQLPHILLAEVLLELPKSLQESFYFQHEAQELADLTQELDTDDAADIIQHIEEIDEAKADALLNSLPAYDRDTIEELISYDDNRAGAYMQVEIFDAHMDETIGDSIKRLKQMKATNQIDNIHHVFVVSTRKKFLGMIPLEDLILHGPKEYYRDIIRIEGQITLSVNAKDEIQTVVEKVSNYGLSVIPVVNDKGKLLGRITSDDIYHIIKEEATDQIYHLAGVNDEAEQEESLWKVGKSRGVWLALNLLTAIAASLVIGFFDGTIQSIVALAILMPIVASMGGNAGTQTLTVTVRQMALGDIDVNEAKETIYKEVLVSLMNGLFFSIVMGVIAYLWFSMPLLGVVIGAAMLINLLSAGFFGAIIPLGLKKFGIDPAIGSTVLLTTVTDVVGFLSFLGLATVILL